MSNILLIMHIVSVVMRIEFSQAEASKWNVVNDGVMGGLSKGKISLTDEGILFSGIVSLANNGGFTSYSSPYQSYDLSDFQQLTIRYKSTGIQQAFQMNVDRRFYIPNYKVHLPNSTEWITKTFDLSDFKQYQLGQPTGKSLLKESKSEIIRLGFITDEKKAGDFQFEVDYFVFK